MKNIQNKLITFICIAFAFFHLGFSQGDLTIEPEYEVNRIYPPLSITKEKLSDAYTLVDLNKYYKSSWIREYISVEVFTSYKGKTRTAMSKNGILSQEQKDIMNKADVGTEIAVKVRYIPENTLKHNDAKEIDFTFTVEPESEAKYPGGQQQLRQYLKEKAIDKIPDGSFKEWDLTAVKFTISEEGEIVNAHIFDSIYRASKNEKLDELLLEAIYNMPDWKPAEYANGLKVKQEFVLTVGNMESCLVNLLNIRRN